MNRLVISDANREDSGRYRCEASNDYSSASAMVDIQVAGKFLLFNIKLIYQKIKY